MPWLPSALVLALFLAACASQPVDPSPATPPAQPYHGPKFEPVPIPLVPSFWKLIST